MKLRIVILIRYNERLLTYWVILGQIGCFSSECSPRLIQLSRRGKAESIV